MKKVIISFKPMSRLGFSLLFSLPCNMLSCSLVYAVQYDYHYDKNGNTIAIDLIVDNQVTRIQEYQYNKLNGNIY